MKEKRDGRSYDMTQGNPMKLILLFSLPLLAGNVFQQFYNMADTIIVGRTISADALAAVGTTGPLNFLVLGFINGLTSGFAVVTAQRFGAKDEQGLRRSVASSYRLCLIVGVLMTVLAVLAAKPLLRMIHTPEELLNDAWRYIVTIFAGIGTMIFYNIQACTLRALGDSKRPLYFLVLSSIVNIGLDLLFILVFRLGVFGAALATVVSQGMSGIACFIYIRKYVPLLRLNREDWKRTGSFARRQMSLGLPMAFQFSITAIGVVVLQGQLNLFGKTKIAAYTAASKVEQLVTQPAVTFGVTMANYAGQNMGANRLDRVRKGVRKSSILTLCFATAALAIVFLFGETLTKLFVDAQENPEVIEAAQLYLRLSGLFYPFLFLIFIFRNTLQGVGRSVMPLLAGVLELLIRVVASYTLPKQFGFQGICLAGPMAWLGAALWLIVAYVVIFRRLIRKDAVLRGRDAGAAVEKADK